eukprot:TRINITY_DN6809_c0_g1_i1.p1 TRINITY_DN6809_c0_g1~~TRINITY_DN6809_c0_g1_i1.p1  ORF type:complete len:930 (-),score=218.93 TRINITY_DN6809_c0_g1_i1:103-2574(-)
MPLSLPPLATGGVFSLLPQALLEPPAASALCEVARPLPPQPRSQTQPHQHSQPSAPDSSSLERAFSEAAIEEAELAWSGTTVSQAYIYESAVDMLLGSESRYFAFDQSSRCFVPRMNRWRGTGTGTAQHMLYELCSYGTQYRTLTEFHEYFCADASRGGLVASSFAHGVGEFLSCYRRELGKLLRDPAADAVGGAMTCSALVMGSEPLPPAPAVGSTTVRGLVLLLRHHPQTRGLWLVFSLIAEGAKTTGKENEPLWSPQCTPKGSRLLDHLVDACTSHGCCVPHVLTLLLARACNTYMAFLWKWVAEGVVEDPHNEFFVARSDSDGVPPFEDKGAETLPTFLQPLHGALFQAGQMSYMLKARAGGCGSNHSMQISFMPEPAMAAALPPQVRQQKQDETPPLQLLREAAPGNAFCLENECPSGFMQHDGEVFDENQLAQVAETEFFAETPVEHSECSCRNRPCSSLTACTHESIASLMQTNVIVPLQKQCNAVTSCVLQLLINPDAIPAAGCFVANLNAVRDYMLLHAGDFADTLVESIATKMDRTGEPPSVQALQESFEEALSLTQRRDPLSTKLRFCERARAVYLGSDTLTQCKRFCDDATPSYLNVLDSARLTYHVDGWPLSLIFTPTAMHKYSQLFDFLLKLKFVSYSLRSSWITLKAASTANFVPPDLARRIGLTRHNMEHFATMLEAYIINQIHQVSFVALMHDLEQHGGLNDLVAAHEAFLEKMLARCLLKKQCAKFGALLAGIFSTVMAFHAHIRNLKHQKTANTDSIDKCRTLFHEQVKFLFEVLCALCVKHGFQPHLQQLLLVLNYNGYYKCE